jgi:lipopolysaccharide exporter
MTADFADEIESDLNQRIARGAFWMIGLRFTDRCIGLLSMIVLARLLVPADFGLVALAMTMVAVIDDLADFGFEMALIRNQGADRSHYDTAWTCGILRGLVASIVLSLLAPALAHFFEEPRLDSVLFALAMAPFLAGFYNVGTVAFRKELTLNKEFVFRIVPRLLGVVITIVFAFVWRNYWALVSGTLGGIASRLLMSYLMHPFRPRLSLGAWREIMGFSKWMLATSIADLISQRAGTLIIAKMLDAASLGIFSISNQIANMAAAELIAPIKQALFPGYAKLAHKPELLKKAFIDVYGILVLIALPAAIGIGLTARYFVPILLGPKWLDAIPIIEILAISGGLRSLSSHVRPVYLAMNRPHLGALASFSRGIIYVPCLLFALWHYGVFGAAVAHAIGHIGVLLGSLYLIHRLLGLTASDIMAACWRPLVGCALMIIGVTALRLPFPASPQGLVDQVLLLVAAVVTGLVAYVGSILLTWQLCGRPEGSSESRLLNYVAQILRKHRAAFRRPASGGQS